MDKALRWMGVLSRVRFAATAGVLACALLVGGAGNARAAEFSVTTMLDSGAGSLREAIQQANATSGEDIIIVSGSVKEITLGSELSISNPVTIQGNGVTLRGKNTRLFSVTNGTAKFDRITFTEGNALSGNGGAVNVDGPANAEFTNCTFWGNTANQMGGAVAVSGTQLSATKFVSCTIAGNTALNGGGVAVTLGSATFGGCIVLANNGRDAQQQGSDVLASGSGSVDRSQYNVIGTTNAAASFPSATFNHLGVKAEDVFATQPLAPSIVDSVLLLPLSGKAGNVARDIIPNLDGSGYPVVDERGTVRPQLAGFDAGSYELTPSPIEAVSMTGSSYIQVGASEKYSVAVSPENATLDTRTYQNGLEWSSSDASVLTVDAEGKATGIRAGEATLYVRAYGWDSNGSPKVTERASIRIRVGTTPLPAPSVTLAAFEDVTMRVDNIKLLTPAVTASLEGIAGSIPYRLEVFSNNISVVSADIIPDANGTQVLLSARNPGKALITVRATATNGAGSSSDSKSFIVTAEERYKEKSGGGGGCNAGFSLFSLAALGALYALRLRKR